LLYCISEIEPQVAPPAQGLRSHAVQRQVMVGMACYVSELAQAPAKLTRDDALAFAKVVAAIFSRTGVIPFRFPTMMDGIDELEVYLETEGRELLESLQRLRDCVQMEVRFSHDGVAAAPPGKPARQRAKQMVEKVADTARESFGELVMAWHTRDVADGLRCYALIARSDVPEFRTKGDGMKVSGEVHIAVTGPWPPAEFLSDPDAEL
jgi:hypothetical protein